MRAGVDEGQATDHIQHMADTLSLPPPLERDVEALVRSGRFGSRDELLAYAVQRLIDHEDERAYAADLQADLEAKLAEALADCEAGRMVDVDVAFDRLEARYTAMARSAAAE